MKASVCCLLVGGWEQNKVPSFFSFSTFPSLPHVYNHSYYGIGDYCYPDESQTNSEEDLLTGWKDNFGGAWIQLLSFMDPSQPLPGLLPAALFKCYVEAALSTMNPGT